MSQLKIPLCIKCKRRVYYGSTICGKKDCSDRFIKLDRVKILSPLSLGYYINNKKPFASNKRIIFSPDLHRKDNNLSNGEITSSSDDIIDNKISLQIIDTFNIYSESIFLVKSKKLNKKQICTEWDEIELEICAYKQDLIGVKNLYLKGVKLTRTVFEHAILNMDKDLIMWLRQKKCPHDKNYIIQNINLLTKDFKDLLIELCYLQKHIGFNYQDFTQNINNINNGLRVNNPNIINYTDYIPIRILQNEKNLQQNQDILNNNMIQITKFNYVNQLNQVYQLNQLNNQFTNNIYKVNPNFYNRIN